MNTHNNPIKLDTIDSAPGAHGCAILCGTSATLLRRLLGPYGPFMSRCLALMFSIILSQTVYGACRSLNLQESYSAADFVFTGTVRDQFETCELLLEDRINTDCSGGAKLAKVEIDTIYKDSSGDPAGRKAQDNILILVDGGDESLLMFSGSQYLMFANHQLGGILGVSRCNGSESIANATEELRQLESIRDLFGENAP